MLASQLERYTESSTVNAGMTVQHFGYTPLTKVVTFSKKETVEQDIMALSTLLNAGTPINEKDGYGNTALHYAVQQGHYELAKFLLVSGADSEIATEKTHDSPLMLAVREGRKRIKNLLIAHGASMTKVPHGKTYSPLELERLLQENPNKNSEKVMLARAGFNIHNTEHVVSLDDLEPTVDRVVYSTAKEIGRRQPGAIQMASEMMPVAANEEAAQDVARSEREFFPYRLAVRMVEGVTRLFSFKKVGCES